MFHDEPFFCFHPQIGLAQGICEAMNFSDSSVVIISDAVNSATIYSINGYPDMKFFKISLRGWTDIDIRIINS